MALLAVLQARLKGNPKRYERGQGKRGLRNSDCNCFASLVHWHRDRRPLDRLCLAEISCRDALAQLNPCCASRASNTLGHSGDYGKLADLLPES